MVPFFRKLREPRLTEGKVFKYLKYAIGEIVLVVIGILIALAINNVNEDRKDIQREQLVLLQLKEDYEANLEQLDEKIAMRDQMNRSSFRILNHIDHPEQANRDSLITYVSHSMMDPTFDPIQNDLMASGALRLIRNEDLKQLLSRWSSEVVQLTETELQWQKIRSEVYIPYIIRSGLARDINNAFWKDEDPPIFILNRNAKRDFIIGPSTHTPDLKSLLADPELEGIVTISFTLNHVCNLQSETLRQRIIELLNLLEAELNKI